MLMSSNSTPFMDAMAWFEWFVALVNGAHKIIKKFRSCKIVCTLSQVGDECPDRPEIHLEMQDIKDIFLEYTEAMQICGRKILTYSTFCKMWVNCFQHVKIRIWKACCGKCRNCAVLTEARRCTKDTDKRAFITFLHQMHRTMYARERQIYLSVCHEAEVPHKPPAYFIMSSFTIMTNRFHF